MPNREMNVDSNYSELPQELWLKIVSLLDEPEDLFNFSQTFRVGYAIAQEESLWQEMNKRYDVKNATTSSEKNKFLDFYNTLHYRILREIKAIEKNATMNGCTDEMREELNTLTSAAKLMHFLENASYRGTSSILLNQPQIKGKLFDKPLALLTQLYNKYGFKKAVETAAECFEMREEEIKLYSNNTCDRAQIVNIGIFLQNILNSLEVSRKPVRRNSL